MSKYSPLTHHLQMQHRQQIPMSFPELEKLLGFHLPPSARKHRAWWSNNPSNSVMTQAWLDAGYQSRDVDLEAERLVFVKLNAADDPSPPGQPDGARPHHPLIGCMAGTIKIANDLDLTEPTAPDWEAQAFAKFDDLLGPQS